MGRTTDARAAPRGDPISDCLTPENTTQLTKSISWHRAARHKLRQRVPGTTPTDGVHWMAQPRLRSRRMLILQEWKRYERNGPRPEAAWGGNRSFPDEAGSDRSSHDERLAAPVEEWAPPGW
jgi:hypothetical protein